MPIPSEEISSIRSSLNPVVFGLRFYNALNENGKKTLVYIGVDANGKDITKKVVVEEGGMIKTIPAIVADRIDFGELWSVIFGK